MANTQVAAQMVKRLPMMQETWVRSLGGEVPLEKEMATHSSTLTWKIPWTEDPGRLHSPGGHKESDTTEQLHFTSNSQVNSFAYLTLRFASSAKEGSR